MTGGSWHVDTNGDGQATDQDQGFQFGQPGDVPVVGDWNGDGVDDLGVYRGGTWYLDTDGNHTLDAHDQVFKLGRPSDMPVAGDWNGDGRDEPGIYRRAAG